MDTVEIVDPAHPLYGKTLPLIGFNTKQHLGRVAIVWLQPGIERCVPLSATNLAKTPLAAPSPSRLSVESLERLLSVVASLPHEPEDADDDARTTSGARSGVEPEGAGATDAALRRDRASGEKGLVGRVGDETERGVGVSATGDEGGGSPELPASDARGGR